MKRIILLVFAMTLYCVIGCANIKSETVGQQEGDEEQVTTDYALRINGVSVKVNKFKHYHYASFDMKHTAKIELTQKDAIESFDISPHSRGIVGSLKDNTVSFELDKPGYTMVRTNEDNLFFIFAEKPQTLSSSKVVSILSYGITANESKNVTEVVKKAIKETSSKGETLLFPAGIYICGQLQLPSDTHIHLERGAVLQTDDASATPYQGNDNVKTRRFIYIKEAQNVKITGYGAINGNGATLRSKFADEARMRLILAVDCDNLLIEGVMLQDPGSWNTQILMCRDVVIRNVKLMNDIDISNTDGFDPDATQRMIIEDCFAYCSDDNVAIKTTNYSNYLADVDDITVRGCVFLTKKSALKVGTETKGKIMRNITFENNDVIQSDRGIALYVADGAMLDNVRYINNRFERNHPDAKQACIHISVSRRNEQSKLGKMKNILIKDCVYEKAFPKSSEIKYADKDDGVSVVIENLTIEGKKITTAEQGNIKVKNATVVFKE